MDKNERKHWSGAYGLSGPRNRFCCSGGYRRAATTTIAVSVGSDSDRWSGASLEKTPVDTCCHRSGLIIVCWVGGRL